MTTTITLNFKAAPGVTGPMFHHSPADAGRVDMRWPWPTMPARGDRIYPPGLFGGYVEVTHVEYRVTYHDGQWAEVHGMVYAEEVTC